MSSTVEQVKARLSIVDVVGGYVKLEKAGVNYKGCCPFHAEKTPSFFVSPGRESYHCFGCSKGGDILSFVQEIEGLDFIGALKMLAERAGVEMETLKRKSPEEKSERDAILAALADAGLLYQSALKKNAGVMAYLKDRGLTDKTVIDFEVGFAPDGWRVLLEELKKRGHAEGIIEKAGLAIRSPKGPLYDRFRNRVMFPLKDQNGSIVGFSGRVLGDEVPKYMNSPETPVFQKSKVLFGIEKAKMPIRKNDAAILVEGQMDLILAHQANTPNAVGVSGTALTEEHLTIVGRLSKNLIMAFDADKAGISASHRAINMALGLGMEVRIALLPDGLDPADLVRKDPEEWRRRVGGARHVIDFFLDVLEKEPDPRVRRQKVEEMILPYVKFLRSPLDQGHFIGKIANFLGQSEQSVWDALAKVKAPTGSPQSQGKNAAQKSTETARPMPTHESLWHKLYGIIEWQKELPAPVIAAGELEGKLEELLGKEETLKLREKAALRRGELTLEAEVAYSGADQLPKTVADFMHNLEEDLLSSRFRAILVSLREAEKRGDSESLKQHLADCQAITSRLTALKTKRYTSNS